MATLPLVCRGDDFRVAHRPTRLNGRRRARFRRGNQTVRERKKRVAADDAPLQRQSRLARFPNRDAAGIDPAHLARANAERPLGARRRRWRWT